MAGKTHSSSDYTDIVEKKSRWHQPKAPRKQSKRPRQPIKRTSDDPSERKVSAFMVRYKN